MLRFLHLRDLGMQHHKVVSITDEFRRSPLCSECLLLIHVSVDQCLFHAMKSDIHKQRGNHAALCEASNYAKRCEKNSDFRPFPVAFLCIVSDDGFEIFLKYLSGEHAYATTKAS